MEEVDVLCINCGEMVPSSGVTEHSKHCQQVHPYLSSMEESEFLRLLDFKVGKLRLAMVTSLQPGFTPLIEIAGALLKTYGVCEEALAQAQEAQEDLTTFLAAHKGTACVALYAERLKVLAADKAGELRLILGAQSQGLHKQLSDKDSEIVRLQRQIEELKGRSSPPPIRPSDEVKSDVASGGRMSSRPSITPPKQADFPKRNPAELASMTDAERQRYFFSQCLAIKLTFSGKSKAQYVKIPQLYEKVKEQSVPIEDWPNFIREELAGAG
jgi:hypothetical protein